MSGEVTGEVRIGTAGWNVPPQYKDAFPTEGSHLQRYAALFRAVEIDTSFYRPHRPATYARWAASVPADFRFAVKLPREITHARRLRGTEAALDRFLSETAALGPKRGPLLVQLPPSFAFDAAVARDFLARLRTCCDDPVVCEPRHPSWFGAAAEDLLASFQVARVAADPAIVPSAARPGGWPGLVYVRLHGSPRMYHSAYGPDRIAEVAAVLGAAAASGRTAWCVFDNTARGEAASDALLLQALRPGGAVAARLRDGGAFPPGPKTL